jgi:UDP-N-acetyl-D-galactosamine dehydrogenase
LLLKKEVAINKSNVLVLGITFKENCPDIRNSKVIDIINELKSYGVKVNVSDPRADYNEVESEYKLELIDNVDIDQFDGIILAVGHSQFLEESFVNKLADYNGIIYDVKGVLSNNIISKRL